MKIILFTSNGLRHKYLANKLSEVSDKLLVISEEKRKRIFKHKCFHIYFKKVKKAEKKIFFSKGNKLKKNIECINIKYNKINILDLKIIKEFQADLFIVFGTSILKGELFNYLVKKNTINIHMGLSPYYNGTDCNFWAAYDNNLDLIGGTIQLLAKKVDSGKILYTVKSKNKKNLDIFERSMLSVKETIDKLFSSIMNKRIFLIKRKKQNLKVNIRQSRIKDFTHTVVTEFLKKSYNA